MIARAILATLALLACTPLAGHAARQPPITVDALLARSGAIIEVSISEVDPFAGREWPATRVRYVIERQLAGQTAGQTAGGTGGFLLPEGVEPGGAVWSGYAGVPEFAPGETYLLFLRHAPWNISPITHWRDGYLRRVTVAGRPLNHLGYSAIRLVRRDGGECR